MILAMLINVLEKLRQSLFPYLSTSLAVDKNAHRWAFLTIIIKDAKSCYIRINDFKIHIVVTQYFRMYELINYISHTTHETLSAIIIGIADKFKIIIVFGDKKYWTDNANPIESVNEIFVCIYLMYSY